MASSEVKVRLHLQHVKDEATTSAEVDMVVHKEWAPVGAERFLTLVKEGYYNEARLYRMVPGFIVQWGIPKNPEDWTKWGQNKIMDDPVKTSNKSGTFSFATSGKDSR